MAFEWLLISVFGIFVIFWVLFLAFVVIFWIWMLIDCLERKEFDDKLVWILILIFLSFLGAILYYFLVRAKPKKSSRRH